MKQLVSVCLFLVFFSCANGKGKTYTGSTPAGPVVREFLGISLTDSIDFIRWLLEIDGNNYKLDCSYGICKPNTNGFMDGGRIIKVNGTIKKDKTIYLLSNQEKELRFAELNTAILHPVDAAANFLTGTEGWSYTLSSLNPLVEPVLSIPPANLGIKDSASYVGRTACGIPGLGKEPCYKLKWHLVLYPGGANDEPGSYKIFGTLYPKESQKTGRWKAIKKENGAIHYELLNEKNLPFLYFIKGAEQVLFMTDSKGKLLVGNEDFSFTLNRVYQD